MEVILLRTLTERSLMKFGRHAELTVMELLALQRTRYLRWVYFNCSKITFTEEILCKIKISDEYRIEKPGVNRDYADALNNRLMQKLLKMSNDSGSVQVYCKIKGHAKKDYKQGLGRKYFSEKHKWTKGSLQARNHGH